MVMTINMAKAVEIKKDQLRAERKPLLEKLDVEFIRAVESGDTEAQATIAAKKVKLRDVTSDAALTTAATPAELKAVRPVILDQV